MPYEKLYEEARNKLANIYINLVQKDGEAAKPFRIAVEALEKQIPKKVVDDCYCPNCNADVRNEADNDYLFECCYHCGQALDWSE